MSIKSRLKALEDVKGEEYSLKIVMAEKNGTFREHQTNKKLIKNTDGKFYYEDGKALHDKENAINLIIKTKYKHSKDILE